MDPFTVTLVISYLGACGTTAAAKALAVKTQRPEDGQMYVRAMAQEETSRDLLDEYVSFQEEE